MSLLTSLSFLLPSLTWAFDPQAYRIGQLPPVFFQQHEVLIPESHGRITDSLQAGDRLVVLIQDLHCNYEVQMNIAHIVDTLADKLGLRLVTLEGAAYPVNVTKLSTFPVQEVKEFVGRTLVRQGQIGGPEYYAAVGARPVRLEGVEDSELYLRNLATVRGFLNAESQGAQADLRDALEALKPGIYSAELARFDQARVSYREGERSLEAYAVELAARASALGIRGADQPNLHIYLQGPKSVFPVALDQDELYRELDRLDRQVREAMYTAPEQRRLDEMVRRLDLIERLINISALPEEVAEFRTARERFSVETFRAFLREQSRNDDPELDPAVFQLDRALGLVDDFYRVAEERSAALTRNVLRAMTRRGEKAAVLVTGGYHTPGITQALRAQGISYVTVLPRLTRQDVVNPYFDLLQERRTPLEKLLLKNQNLFAVPLNSAQVRPGEEEVVLNEAPGRLEDHVVTPEPSALARVRLHFSLAQVLFEMGSLEHLARSGDQASFVRRLQAMFYGYPANFNGPDVPDQDLTPERLARLYDVLQGQSGLAVIKLEAEQLNVVLCGRGALQGVTDRTASITGRACDFVVMTDAQLARLDVGRYAGTGPAVVLNLFRSPQNAFGALVRRFSAVSDRRKQAWLERRIGPAATRYRFEPKVPARDRAKIILANERTGLLQDAVRLALGVQGISTPIRGSTPDVQFTYLGRGVNKRAYRADVPVVLADGRRLTVPVTVKVPHPGLGLFVRGVQRAWRSWLRGHPFVPAFFLMRRGVIVQEYVPGQTVPRSLNDLDAAERRQIVREAVRAYVGLLVPLWREGRTHWLILDPKPQNIILRGGPENGPKIIDLGAVQRMPFRLPPFLILVYFAAFYGTSALPLAQVANNVFSPLVLFIFLPYAFLLTPEPGLFEGFLDAFGKEVGSRFLEQARDGWYFRLTARSPFSRALSAYLDAEIREYQAPDQPMPMFLPRYRYAPEEFRQTGSPPVWIEPSAIEGSVRAERPEAQAGGGRDTLLLNAFASLGWILESGPALQRLAAESWDELSLALVRLLEVQGYWEHDLSVIGRERARRVLAAVTDQLRSIDLPNASRLSLEELSFTVLDRAEGRPDYLEADEDLGRLGVFQVGNRIFLTRDILPDLDDAQLTALLLYAVLRVRGQDHRDAAQRVLAASGQSWDDLVQAAQFEDGSGPVEARNLFRYPAGLQGRIPDLSRTWNDLYHFIEGIERETDLHGVLSHYEQALRENRFRDRDQALAVLTSVLATVWTNGELFRFDRLLARVGRTCSAYFTREELEAVRLLASDPEMALPAGGLRQASAHHRRLANVLRSIVRNPAYVPFVLPPEQWDWALQEDLRAEILDALPAGRWAGALLGRYGETLLQDILNNAGAVLLPGQAIAEWAAAAGEGLGNVLAEVWARVQVSPRPFAESSGERGPPVRAALAAQLDEARDAYRGRADADPKVTAALDALTVEAPDLRVLTADAPKGAPTDTDLDRLGVFHLGGTIYLTASVLARVAEDPALAAILLHEALETAGIPHDLATVLVRQATVTSARPQGYTNAELIAAAGLTPSARRDVAEKAARLRTWIGDRSSTAPQAFGAEGTEAVLRALPPDLAAPAEMADWVLTKFGANWTEAMSLLGPNLLDRERRPLMLLALETDTPLAVLADLMEFTTHLGRQPLDAFPLEFQRLALRAARTGVGRDTLAELWLVYYLLRPVPPELTANEALHQELATRRPDLTRSRATLLRSRTAGADDLTLVRMILKAGEKERPAVSAYLPEGIRHWNLRVEEQQEVDALVPGEVFSGPLRRDQVRSRDAGVVSTLENERWFTLWLRDPALASRIPYSYPEIAEWFPENEPLLSTVQYERLDDGRTFRILDLQAWLRTASNDVPAEVRSGLGDLEAATERAFRAYAAAVGCRTLMAPIGASLFRGTQLFIHRNTIARINRLYLQAGYRLEFRDGRLWWVQDLMPAEGAGRAAAGDPERGAGVAAPRSPRLRAPRKGSPPALARVQAGERRNRMYELQSGVLEFVGEFHTYPQRLLAEHPDALVKDVWLNGHGGVALGIKHWEYFKGYENRRGMTVEFRNGKVVRVWAGDPYPSDDPSHPDLTVPLVKFSDPKLAAGWRLEGENILYLRGEDGTWRPQEIVGRAYGDKTIARAPDALVKQVGLGGKGILKFGSQENSRVTKYAKRRDLTVEFSGGKIVRIWAGDPYPFGDPRRPDPDVPLVWFAVPALAVGWRLAGENLVYLRGGDGRWLPQEIAGRNYGEGRITEHPDALLKKVAMGGKGVLKFGREEISTLSSYARRQDLTVEFRAGRIYRVWAGDPYPDDMLDRPDPSVPLIWFAEPAAAQGWRPEGRNIVHRVEGERLAAVEIAGGDYAADRAGRHRDGFVKNCRFDKDGGFKHGGKRRWWSLRGWEGRGDVTAEYRDGELVRVWVGDPYPENDLSRPDPEAALVWTAPGIGAEWPVRGAPAPARAGPASFRDLSDAEARDLAARVNELVEGGRYWFEEEGIAVSLNLTDARSRRMGRILRIGPLVLVMVDPPADLEREVGRLKERLGDLYRANAGNILFANSSEFDENRRFPLSDLTISLIQAMVRYRDDLAGAAVLDAGAYDGILARVALRLGAARAVLIERDHDRVEASRIFLRADGLSVGEDADAQVQVWERTLVPETDVPGILRDLGTDRPLAALMNFGTYYWDVNLALTRALARWPRVRAIFNGGHLVEGVARRPEDRERTRTIAALLRGEGMSVQSMERDHALTWIARRSGTGPDFSLEVPGGNAEDRSGTPEPLTWRNLPGVYLRYLFRVSALGMGAATALLAASAPMSPQQLGSFLAATGLAALGFSALLLPGMLIHELGHYLAIRVLLHRTPRMVVLKGRTFWTLQVDYADAPVPTFWQEIVIALSGPLVSLVFWSALITLGVLGGAVAWPAGLTALIHAPALMSLVLMGVYTSLLQLLPFTGSDGLSLVKTLGRRILAALSRSLSSPAGQEEKPDAERRGSPTSRPLDARQSLRMAARVGFGDLRAEYGMLGSVFGSGVFLAVAAAIGYAKLAARLGLPRLGNGAELEAYRDLPSPQRWSVCYEQGGVIFLDKEAMLRLPRFVRELFILHERAHAERNADERQAYRAMVEAVRDRVRPKRSPARPGAGAVRTERGLSALAGLEKFSEGYNRPLARPLGLWTRIRLLNAFGLTGPLFPLVSAVLSTAGSLRVRNADRGSRSTAADLETLMEGLTERFGRGSKTGPKFGDRMGPGARPALFFGPPWVLGRIFGDTIAGRAARQWALGSDRGAYLRAQIRSLDTSSQLRPLLEARSPDLLARGERLDLRTFQRLALSELVDILRTHPPDVGLCAEVIAFMNEVMPLASVPAGTLEGREFRLPRALVEERGRDLGSLLDQFRRFPGPIVPRQDLEESIPSRTRRSPAQAS